MMMKAEAERAAVNDTMISFLGKFISQGEEKLNLMKSKMSQS